MKFKILTLSVVLLGFGLAAYSKPLLAKTTTANLFDKSAIIADGLYKFKGNLNGKIPVFIWLLIKDSIIKGEVTYLRTAKHIPIKLVGTIVKDQGPVIYEFDPGGHVTGIYEGKLNASTFTGTWYNPNSNKELKYMLNHSDSTLAAPNTAFHPVNMTGQYQYFFGKAGAGGSGSISILTIKAKVAKVEVNCVTAAPAFNLADVEPFTAPVANNTIIYKMKDADCKFKIRVFENFVVITPLTDDLMQCGFGMNATIEGVYFKTSDKANFNTER
ncbi:hypothetical protein GCM10027037_34590 [Mucilaginibacter koreensis]